MPFLYPADLGFSGLKHFEADLGLVTRNKPKSRAFMSEGKLAAGREKTGGRVSLQTSFFCLFLYIPYSTLVFLGRALLLFSFRILYKVFSRIFRIYIFLGDFLIFFLVVDG